MKIFCNTLNTILKQYKHTNACNTMYIANFGNISAWVISLIGCFDHILDWTISLIGCFANIFHLNHLTVNEQACSALY